MLLLVLLVLTWLVLPPLSDPRRLLQLILLSHLKPSSMDVYWCVLVFSFLFKEERRVRESINYHLIFLVEVI